MVIFTTHVKFEFLGISIRFTPFLEYTVQLYSTRNKTPLLLLKFW